MTTEKQYFIGRKLNYLREGNDVTKMEVADSLDISYYHYNCLEDNVRSVDKKLAEKICLFYRMPISYLIEDNYDSCDKTLKALTHSIELLSKDDHDELVRFAEFLTSKK